MSVIFKTFEQIEIDGIPSGNIVDVVSNHAARRLQVLEAYRVYTDKLNADNATALQAAQADLATKTTELATATQAKTMLESQVATLTSEKQELQSRVADADQALDAEQQMTATLQSKVAELEQYRPYNPRILAGEAFYARVSKEDMVTLLTSSDAMLITVGKTIESYRANKWPVVMDSTDFQNLVGYVRQSGVFDESEVVEIMQDATREEAYRVPE